jgi:rRNA maturation endonuclease Nob1
VNGFMLKCLACRKKWPVGTDVSDFERASLESTPCPICHSHVLRCVPNLRARRPRKDYGQNAIVASSARD